MKVLNISTSRPTIDISSTRAQMQIKQTVVRHFSMRRTPPEMSVNRTSPKMKVNWKQVWANRGLRSPDFQNKYQRDQSRQKVYESIQKRNADAAFLGAVEEYAFTDTNRVGQLAYNDMLSEGIKEINVAPPNPMPEVEWDTGSLSIEWTRGDLELVWEEDFRPQLTVTPHSVEIRLNGRREVKITVNENGVSTTSGKKVDKKV
ncbi:MAG: hypothetical protein HDQ87_02715 [Clostridia bacterium]|nr:hypothetical protein [Clostridia bacterium]